MGDESVSSAFAEAELSEPSTQTITVDYVVSGTADPASDFTLTGGTVSFAPGDVTEDILIDMIVDDMVVETDETVVITLINPANAMLGTVTEFTYTIGDNDSAALTIMDASGSESGGPITVSVTLDSDVQGGFTVDVGSLDGTATTADMDYTAVNTTLTFAGTAGEVQTLTVDPIDDNTYECDEDLTLELSNLGAIMTSAIDLTDTATVTITNDDDAFEYGAAAYCQDDTDPSAIVSGNVPGGVFSSTLGLVIDPITGTIDVSASRPGIYDVTYTVAQCNSYSEMETVEINTVDDATFAYNSTTYCQDDADPVATISGNTGGAFTSGPGLVINPSNGVIDLSASVAGTYTVTYTTGGQCPASSTQMVTIDAVDDATFSYPASSYCAAGVDPTPTVTGTTGGSFTSGAGLVIDPSTGTIDLSASTPGLYAVTYTTTGSCDSNLTVSVRINTQDDATFAYNASTYCADEADPIPSLSGTTGGTYSSTGGLAISPTTGVIDLSASTPGTYVVTYTTPGVCGSSSTASVTVNAVGIPAFNYPATTFCADSTDPSPAIQGTTGGTFGAGAGLVIDPNTGTIDISASATGSYTVTYTTPGPCSDTGTFDLRIAPLMDATFSYPRASYCSNDADPVALISGATGGTFSSTGGIAINPSNGAVDLSNSVPGTYVVTYFTPAPCQNTSTQTITIDAQDDASFSYAAGAFCNNAADPVPTITGTTGGTFSSSAGLVINSATGQIDVSASTVGAYVVTYATSGRCAASSTRNVTIENFDLGVVTFGDATFTFDGTSRSIFVDNLPPTASVTYSNNGQVNAGTYLVTAVVTSGTTSCGSVTLQATLTILRAPQTITFAPLAPRNLINDTNFQLTATASSGLPVTYTFNPLTAPDAVSVTPGGFVTLLNEGFVDITATQPGSANFLPATSVTRELEVFLNSDTNIDTISFNGDVFNDPANELRYVIGCDDQSDEVEVVLTNALDATFDPGQTFTVDTPRAGIYRRTITVTAQNGRDVETYDIEIERQFRFDEIVEQKYDNILVVNNNPANNGGYEFVAYEWYKNGQLVTTEQFYSEGDRESDRLDPDDRFFVRMTLANGDVLQTCVSTPSLGNTFSFNVVTNPVVGTATLDVTADFPQGELDGATYRVFDISGRLVATMASSSSRTSIELPVGLPSAVYVVVLQTTARTESIKFIKK